MHGRPAPKWNTSTGQPSVPMMLGKHHRQAIARPATHTETTTDSGSHLKVVAYRSGCLVRIPETQCARLLDDNSVVGIVSDLQATGVRSWLVYHSDRSFFNFKGRPEPRRKSKLRHNSHPGNAKPMSPTSCCKAATLFRNDGKACMHSSSHGLGVQMLGVRAKTRCPRLDC